MVIQHLQENMKRPEYYASPKWDNDNLSVSTADRNKFRKRHTGSLLPLAPVIPGAQVYTIDRTKLPKNLKTKEGDAWPFEFLMARFRDESTISYVARKLVQFAVEHKAKALNWGHDVDMKHSSWKFVIHLEGCLCASM